MGNMSQVMLVKADVATLNFIQVKKQNLKIPDKTTPETSL